MQTYKIAVSELVKTDLKNIVAYMSEATSMTQAKYVERSILSEMKCLKHFPMAYPKDEYANTDNTDVRFVMKWHYKILFFVDVNVVQVIGIFHTAQNPNKLSMYGT